MKSRSLLFIVAALLVIAVVASGCGGAKTTTPTPSTTPTTTTTTTQTTQTTQTTTSTTTTTTTTTTTPSGGTLPATGIAITTHSKAVMASYKDLCLMCHGAATSNQFPLPPSWDGAKNGSVVNKGVYTIATGSPQDHTGRAVDGCTASGCHTAPTA